MTPDEFGAKIKSKYPEYASIDNLELSKRIVSKYPEYSSHVNFDVPEQKQASQDYGEALLTNKPTDGFGQDIVRGLPATAGALAGAGAAATASLPFAPLAGPFAPAVPIVAGMVGAGLGAFGGEGVRQGVAQATSAAFPESGYPMLSPKESVGRMAAQGATQAVGEGLGVAGGAALKYVGGKMLRPAAQMLRVMTGVPEREGMSVLRDPGMLSRAKPIAEAGRLYREGVGSAGDTSMEAGRAFFGKTYPGPEAAVNKFDEVAGVLDASPPDELLGMRQTMMDTLSDTPFTSPKLRKMLVDRIQILDDKLEGLLPNFGGAKQAWREAKVGEEFGSWLPLNKNLSPNVLRAFTAGGAAIGAVATGNPMALAMPLAMSPKVWGGVIRAANVIPGEAFKAGAQSMSGGAGSAIIENQSLSTEYEKLRPR